MTAWNTRSLPPENWHLVLFRILIDLSGVQAILGDSQVLILYSCLSVCVSVFASQKVRVMNDALQSRCLLWSALSRP